MDVVGVATWVIAGVLLLSKRRGVLAPTPSRPANTRPAALVVSPRVLTCGALVLLGAAVAVTLGLLR